MSFRPPKPESKFHAGQRCSQGLRRYLRRLRGAVSLGLSLCLLSLSCGEAGIKQPSQTPAPPVKPGWRPPSPIPPIPHEDEGELCTNCLELAKTIATMANTARFITLDGEDSDWLELPTYGGDDAIDPELQAYEDLVQTSFAPTPEALYIKLKTRGRPLPNKLSIRLELDFMASPHSDIRVTCAPTTLSTLEIFEPGKQHPAQFLAGITIATGSVIEIKIPLDLLNRHLPSQVAEALLAPTDRAFVRMSPAIQQAGRVLNWGPQAAAYWLKPNPYPFESRLANASHESYAIDPLVDGQWFVAAGPYEPETQTLGWYYSLTRIPEDDPAFGGNNIEATITRPLQSYLAYGQAISAPMAGQVLARTDQNDDQTGLVIPAPRGNFLTLLLPKDYQLLLEPIKKASLKVGVGERVQTRTHLGDVGGPNLKLALFHPTEQASVPIALNQVAVSLNATATDPFRLIYQRWRIRSGYFVGRASTDASE